MPTGYAKISGHAQYRISVLITRGLLFGDLAHLLLQHANASKRLSSAENLKHARLKFPPLHYVSYEQVKIYQLG